MQRLIRKGVAPSLVAIAATLSLGVHSAVAQTPRRAPTRVNTDSIRTNNGGALLRSFREGESQDYEGGFLHLYPAHNMQRHAHQDQGVAYAQFAQDPQGVDLLPPPTSPGGGEEVMGIMDPRPDSDEPVFADSNIVPPDGFLADGCPAGNCGGNYGKGGKGGKGYGYGGFDDWNWACVCLPLPPMDNLSVNVGVHGFKDQLSLGLDDSFGFQEGFNLGAALPIAHWGLGWQIGLQAVQSNFSGAGDAALFQGPESDRSQLFFTWGFFRRVDCGLQGGIVIDHLRDEWYYDFNLTQLRGEFSVLHDCYHEFGIFFHTGLDRDTWELDVPNYDDEEFRVEATDLFAVFYRHHFDDCGYSYMRAYVGLTDSRSFWDDDDRNSSAILGGDLHMGISDRWAIETGFTFIPSGSEKTEGATQEDWNVGINVIWYPYCLEANTMRRYYRPLFNVADNGSFLKEASYYQD